MTGLRARWEVLREDPLTIVDIGHNPPALALNFARLEAYDRPLLIVYGAMADKDVDGIVKLMPKDAKYFLVAPKTPRAMSTDNLALKLKTLDYSCHGSVADGVAAAMQEASGLNEPIVYIGGSTYVASEAISFIEKL
jgi:dihydrofolate synthase/folylpolyglutamate synthase